MRPRMITKIYEDYTEETTRWVTKKIKKEVEETRYKTHTRTRYVKNGPTGTHRCLHCGIVLESRMWRYSNKNNKFLCKECWYSLSRAEINEYRKLCNQGYNSVEMYEERIPYQVKIEKIVNELVEETESVPGRRIVDLPEHPYPTNNKIILNTINTLETLSDILLSNCGKKIDPDNISENSDWFGAHSISETIDHIFENKPMEFRVMRNLPDVHPGYESEDEVVEFKEILDVVGHYPNVPYYIQGYPLDMFNVKCIRTPKLIKIIHIWCNLAIDSMYEWNDYYKRGIAVFNMVEHFRNSVCPSKIKLTIMDATFTEGETIIQKIDFDEESYEANRQVIFNILTNVCAYRVAFLNLKMKLIDEQNLSESWTTGHGFCMRAEDVGKTIDIGDDIYFGTPGEIKTIKISKTTNEIDCAKLGKLSCRP